MNNIEKYNNAFNSIFNIQVEKLQQNIDADSIQGWDSITQLRLVTKIEDEFDVMFEPEDILEFKSYFKGMEILKKYGIEF
jgi:acyl carrier protein